MTKQIEEQIFDHVCEKFLGNIVLPTLSDLNHVGEQIQQSTWNKLATVSIKTSISTIRFNNLNSY